MTEGAGAFTMQIQPSMKQVLEALVNEIELNLPSLKASRATIPFANDCYEAAYYWRDLGRSVLESNTKVNYPERARGERMLLARLTQLLETRTPEQRSAYAPVLRAGSKLVEIVSTVKPPADGHLGFLRIVRKLFSFLQTELQFKETDTQPASIRFSSGVVYLELNGLARDPWSSCCFGLESSEPRNFWIHDLLYLNHNETYLHLPERLDLRKGSDLEGWFGSLAELLQQYGTPVLKGDPATFEALREAQTNRDTEYALEMERRFGSEGRARQFNELTSRLGPLKPGRRFTRDEMNER